MYSLKYLHIILNFRFYQCKREIKVSILKQIHKIYHSNTKYFCCRQIIITKINALLYLLVNI